MSKTAIEKAKDRVAQAWFRYNESLRLINEGRHSPDHQAATTELYNADAWLMHLMDRQKAEAEASK